MLIQDAGNFLRLYNVEDAGPSGSPAEIVGTNPTQGMDVCVVSVACCQVEVSATD